MKEGIVFLGPLGATFSADAYNVLAGNFGAPVLNCSATYISVKANTEIIPTLVHHGFNYGVIAMETLAGGRVVEPVESFVELMNYTEAGCPISVIGAIKMELHFALMVKRGTRLTDICKVIAHDKALGACRKSIERAGFISESRSSNGLAALEVSSSGLTNLAALGPVSAAEKYDLSVVSGRFEDGKAVTTFFLLGSEEMKPVVLEHNRALITFRVKHCVGSLVEALLPFKDENLSLIHIHSIYAGKNEYDFAIEIELEKDQLSNFDRAVEKFKLAISKCLVFGPFGVIKG
jgi:prephenate dehydratase